MLRAGAESTISLPSLRNRATSDSSDSAAAISVFLLVIGLIVAALLVTRSGLFKVGDE